ncbi:hypothetical protein GGI07_005020 [Coemansia sp. Benny D115]|nr:hypothetical protein GGI07_005020 [Coemansia sp. Benny D115]
MLSLLFRTTVQQTFARQRAAAFHACAYRLSSDADKEAKKPTDQEMFTDTATDPASADAVAEPLPEKLQVWNAEIVSGKKIKKTSPINTDVWAQGELMVREYKGKPWPHYSPTDTVKVPLTNKVEATPPKGTTWEQLGLDPQLVKRLNTYFNKQYDQTIQDKGQLQTAPSEIQRMAIPHFLTEKYDKRTPICLASPIGTGKTLAYVLPLVTRLVNQMRRDPRIRVKGAPRALVLVHTMEEAEKLNQLLRQLGCDVDTNSFTRAVDRSEAWRKEHASNNYVDILVSTPLSALGYLKYKGIFSYKEIRTVVVDDSDKLLDPRLYKTQVVDILSTLRKHADKNSQRVGTIFATATAPTMIKRDMEYSRENLLYAVAKDFNDAPMMPQIRFVDTDKEYHSDMVEILRAINRLVPRYRHQLVVCNTAKQANAVHRILYRKCIPALLLVGQPDSKDRAENAPADSDRRDQNRLPYSYGKTGEALKEAMAPKHEIPDKKGHGFYGPIKRCDRTEVLRFFQGDGTIPKNLLPYIKHENKRVKNFVGKTMVCTGYSIKGVDTSNVGYVFMFDLPETVEEFMEIAKIAYKHNNRGRVVALVRKGEHELVRRIKDAVRLQGVDN